MPYPNYSRNELIADGIVHVIGIAAGIAAAIALAVMAIARADPWNAAGLGVYAFGLIAMLVCSALYNMTNRGRGKEIFRRLDHAAIFLMIAGSYTPFALLAIGGDIGFALLLFVWLIAGIGIMMKLAFPPGWERLSIATYLLLGWTIVFALDPLFTAISPLGLSLLATGGVIYSIGVIFHRWTSLPFQNAIWHVFVLVAASCHFVAVLTDVAMAGQ